MERIIERLADDEGAHLVEYGLLLLGIAVAAAISVSAFGGEVKAWYDSFVGTL